MRVLAKSTIVIVLLASATLAGRQTTPDTLLAQARQALGGDAALAAVTSFSATGTFKRQSGISLDYSLEFDCVLPGQFVRNTSRSIPMSPIGHVGGGTVTELEGFNGDDPITETIQPDSSVPTVMHFEGPATTPEEIAKRRKAQTNAHKHIFLQLTLPLFAASFSSYPLDFTYAGQVQTPKGMAEAIDVTGADNYRSRLLLDVTTHLPLALIWVGKPIVTSSTTSSPFRMNSQGQVIGPTATMAAPQLPKPSELPDVEWRLDISDYKTVNGLNWPRRFISSFGGKTWEDTKINAFKINPEINPNTFKPSK